MLNLVKLDKDQHKFISFIEDQTGHSKSAIAGLLIEAGIGALLDPEELAKMLDNPDSDISELKTLLLKWKAEGVLLKEEKV